MTITVLTLRDELRPAFLALWITVGLGASIFFWTGSDGLLKRKLLLPALLLLAALFLSVIWSIEAPVFIAVPMIAFVTFVNYFAVKFCGNCGQLARFAGFLNSKFCTKCGGRLV